MPSSSLSCAKRSLESIFSDSSLVPQINLSRVRRTGKPNDALFADLNEAMSAGSVDGPAAIVRDKSIDEIRSIICAFAVEDCGGVERREASSSSSAAAGENGLYVIRTPGLRFPDGLYYWIEETEGGAVKVSLYSKSVYGYSDWGVNRKRLDAVIKRLTAKK